MNKFLNSSKDFQTKSGHIPEWGLELEPVRKLATNVGSRIRNCVYRALEKDPPAWAKKRLELSISKGFYKGNASGPTKKAVIAVLTDLKEEILQEKLKKEEEEGCNVNSGKDLDLKTICLQCGDVGFDAYVYCIKCVKFAVHRYCLPEMPKTSDETVHWVCDACEAVSSGSAQLADEPNANNDWSRKENVSMKHEHQRSTSQHLDGVWEANLAVDESLQATNKINESHISSSSSRKKERLPTTLDQKRFDGELPRVTSRHHGEEVDECVKEEESLISARGNGNEEVSRDPIIPPPIAELSGNSIQVQPVVDPIWRGQFDIVNKKGDTLGGFVAHLSSRACQQVIEEARLLPALLQLEMVSKSTVWPKSFQKIVPSDDNIALYIFPSDKRYEKAFDHLVVDMSEEELAMRTTTKNAELLIFSSTELPIKYWRIRNKYFIWGVFKAKRSTSSEILENRVEHKPWPTSEP